MARRSDRWVTPGVIVAAMALGTLVVLSVVASVTYLTARGADPDPMLRLAAEVAGSVALVANLLLTLTGRAGQAKVERNTGQLTTAVVETLEVLEEERGRHAAQPAQDGPAELVRAMGPGTRPHPLYGQSTAPAADRR
jgi:hypothetical protein